MSKNKNKKDFIILWNIFKQINKSPLPSQIDTPTQTSDTISQTTETSTPTENDIQELNEKDFPVTLESFNELQYLGQRPEFDIYSNNFDFILKAPKKYETKKVYKSLLKVSADYVEFYNNRLSFSLNKLNNILFSYELLFEIILKHTNILKLEDSRIMYLDNGNVKIHSFNKQGKQILLTDKIEKSIKYKYPVNTFENYYNPVDFSKLKQINGYYYFIIETPEADMIPIENPYNGKNIYLNNKDDVSQYEGKLTTEDEKLQEWSWIKKVQEESSNEKYISMLWSPKEISLSSTIDLKKQIETIVNSDEDLRKNVGNMNIEDITFFNKKHWRKLLYTESSYNTQTTDLFKLSDDSKKEIFVNVHFNNYNIKEKDKSDYKYILLDTNKEQLYVKDIQGDFLTVLYRIQQNPNKYYYNYEIDTKVMNKLHEDLSTYGLEIFNKLPEDKFLSLESVRVEPKNLSYMYIEADDEGFINFEYKFKIKNVQELDKICTKLNISSQGVERKAYKYTKYSKIIETKITEIYTAAKEKYGRYLFLAISLEDALSKNFDYFKNSIIFHSPNYFKDDEELDKYVENTINGYSNIIKSLTEKAEQLKKLSNPDLTSEEMIKALDLLHTKDNKEINTKWQSQVEIILNNFNKLIEKEKSYFNLTVEDGNKLEHYKTITLPKIMENHKLDSQEDINKAVEEATQALNTILDEAVKRTKDAYNSNHLPPNIADTVTGEANPLTNN